LIDAEKHIDKEIYPQRYETVVKLLNDPNPTPKNYKDTHRNKPENYFLGLLDIKGVLLIPCFHPFNNKN
jgi:hypothetical protein